MSDRTLVLILIGILVCAIVGAGCLAWWLLQTIFKVLMWLTMLSIGG